MTVMSQGTIWDLDSHTKAKHELLRRYLGAWFPILTARGFTRRVLFLDGFAGPGIYAGGEPGSPIVALDTLVNHAHFDRLNHAEFVFLFVEPDEDRFTSLEREIARFWAVHTGGAPKNVRVHTFNDTFEAVANELLKFTREQKKELAPTLAFVDPFGWSGVPLTLIAELVSFDRCEVLFNFMYDSVNRWVTDTRPGIARHFADLFGTTEADYAAAASLTGNQRKYFLRDLYMKQLADVGGFRHVRAFELMDVDRGRTAYYLMFGTRHHRGLQLMKEAMWALDPAGGTRFSGFAGGQQMMFDDVVDTSPLRAAIIEEFAGQVVTVDRIERFVVEQTDYKATHYKKQVLKPLEVEGGITCESQRKRSGTYPSGTMLRFVSSGG